MNRNYQGNDIPAEYSHLAELMFPNNGFSQGKPDVKTAVDFAEALGISSDYRRLLSVDKNAADLKTFLDHFQNNLDLLIQKTWVEKSDEARKEKLQDDVPVLMSLIERGNYYEAIDEFGKILEELAYLFFGAQSAKDDFTEYTFRIDSQIGLFWWYGCRLAMLKDTNKKITAQDSHILWAVLLLGLCYLTNF
ncbi:MAG: hypothetical protein LBV17_02200 [Treponema sp.]|jgi:hypothetical protein|nr:hypothetical protein [Treponema sp.]